MINEKTQALVQFLESEGYQHVRVLEDGCVAACSELLFTRALYIGLTFTGWDKRYCFEDRSLAVAELAKLKDQDSVPQGWIAQR